MQDGPETDYRRAVEEAIEGVYMEPSQREHFVRLMERLDRDDEALILLKGHLVIEERINAVIEKFVWNAQYIDRARLSFAQKIALARAMSMDESENSMWDLIEKLNTLRNKLAHSLEGEPRAKSMIALRNAFKREVTNPDREEINDDRVLLAGVISMCLGFVHALEQEVERFRRYVNLMDRAMNPHRYRIAETKPDDLASQKES